MTAKPAPIALNLHNLTQDNINEAFEAGPNACRYSAPCIIGSLLSTTERERIRHTENDATRVNVVLHRGVFTFPDERQESLAGRIQDAFDRRRWGELEELLTPFNLKLPEEYR